jgi:hypothetical protein
MKPLVQNQYGADWMKMNAQRAEVFDVHSHYIHPKPTLATQGHMHGAAMSLRRSAGACCETI